MLERLQNILDLALEALESIGLIICLLLSAPLRFFRRLDRFERYVYTLRVMIPQGLLAPMLRAHLEDRMGNHQQAANVLDQIAYTLEQVDEGKRLVTVSRVLTDIYCHLFRQHLMAGNVEEATIVVIRAHQHTGLERLPCTPGFDVKVASVVKAGIAAGKLLEEGGLATLMVRQGDDPLVKGPGEKGKLKDKRGKKSEGATIIPFPSPSN